MLGLNSIHVSKKGFWYPNYYDMVTLVYAPPFPSLPFHYYVTLLFLELNSSTILIGDLWGIWFIYDYVIKWSLVTGVIPTQRPVTRSFDVFFDLRLNKRLSKQSLCWWFVTRSRSLWRQCIGILRFLGDHFRIAYTYYRPFPSLENDKMSRKLKVTLQFNLSSLSLCYTTEWYIWKLNYRIKKKKQEWKKLQLIYLSILCRYFDKGEHRGEWRE